MLCWCEDRGLQEHDQCHLIFKFGEFRVSHGTHCKLGIVQTAKNRQRLFGVTSYNILCVCVCVCVSCSRNKAAASPNESDAVIGAKIGNSPTWLLIRKWGVKFPFLDFEVLRWCDSI